jgi:hypothetical protein
MTFIVPVNTPVTGPAGEINPTPLMEPFIVKGANVLFIFIEVIYVIFVIFPPTFYAIPYLLFKVNPYSFVKFKSYLLFIFNYSNE